MACHSQRSGCQMLRVTIRRVQPLALCKTGSPKSFHCITAGQSCRLCHLGKCKADNWKARLNAGENGGHAGGDQTIASLASVETTCSLTEEKWLIPFSCCPTWREELFFSVEGRGFFLDVAEVPVFHEVTLPQRNGMNFSGIAYL